MLRFALVASAWKVGGFTTPVHVRNGALLNEVAPLRPTPGLSRCSTRGLVGGSTGSGRLDGTWHADNSQEKSCNSFQVCGAVVPTNLTSCTSSEGGNTTKTYVLGPFTSHGGYDWWHLNFDAPQDDLYMLGSWSMTLHDADASDPTAAILGLPPLHMHHIFEASGFVEHTGDNQCAAAEEGYECLAHDYFSLGYLFNHTYIKYPNATYVRGVVNDVRLPNAPTLNWYLNLTLNYIAPELVVASRPQYLSRYMHVTHAYTPDFFLTMLVPTQVDSFAMIESQWPESITIVTDDAISRFHSHNAYSHSSFLINAPLAEIGLDGPSFRSSTGCTSVKTAGAGFANNMEMLSHLLTRYPRYFSFEPPDSQLLCRAITAPALVGDFAYDRRPRFDCRAEQIPLTANATFTILSFFGPRPEPFIPETAYRGNNATNVTTAHAHWFFGVLGEEVSSLVLIPPLVHSGPFDTEVCSTRDVKAVGNPHRAPVA